MSPQRSVVGIQMFEFDLGAHKSNQLFDLQRDFLEHTGFHGFQSASAWTITNPSPEKASGQTLRRRPISESIPTKPRKNKNAFS